MVTEANGKWGAAKQLPGIATLEAKGGSQGHSVGCATGGTLFCAVGGWYTAGSSDQEVAFVATVSDTSASGVWGTVEDVPGLTTLTADDRYYGVVLSCGSDGGCSALGDCYDGGAQDIWVSDLPSSAPAVYSIGPKGAPPREGRSSPSTSGTATPDVGFQARLAGVSPGTDRRGRQLRDRLLRHALSLPEAWEDHPWGESVAKVGTKVFLFSGGPVSSDPGVTLKLAASLEEALSLGAQPAGYGLGRAGWVSFTCSSPPAPAPVLEDWVEESYRLVAPKRVSRQLDERAKPPPSR